MLLTIVVTYILGESKKEILKDFVSDFEKNGNLSPKCPKYESPVVIYTKFDISHNPLSSHLHF